jgi:hypothetical protein
MKTMLLLPSILIGYVLHGQSQTFFYKGAIDSAYFFHMKFTLSGDNRITGQYKYDSHDEWIDIDGAVAGDNVTVNEYVTKNGARTKNSVFIGTKRGINIIGTWVKLDGKYKVMPFYFTQTSNMDEKITLCHSTSFFGTAPDKRFPVKKNKIYTLIPDNVYNAGAVVWFDEPYGDKFTISFEYQLYDDDGTAEQPSYNSADGICVILFKDKLSYVGAKVPNGGRRGFIEDGKGIGVDFDVYGYRKVKLKNGNGSVIAEVDAPVYTGTEWSSVSITVDNGTITCLLNGDEILTGNLQPFHKNFSGFGIGAGTGDSDASHRVKNVRITRNNR